MGMVSALGIDLHTSWGNMLEGQSGSRLAEHFGSVGELPPCAAAWVDWEPQEHIDRRDIRRTSRATQFAWKAAQEALAHSQLNVSKEDASRVGIEISNAFGGWELVESQSRVFYEKGYRRVNPALGIGALISGTPTFIGMRLGVTGVVNSSVTACATGISSIGEGARRIQMGEADVVLAGGSDGYVTPIAATLFLRLGAMSREYRNPAMACAPFSGNRSGMVIGEGAGVVILESLDHAQARGATILAEYGGYALRLDPHDFAHPDPEGKAACYAMQCALEDAELEPSDLDWIVAHGTATVANDSMETKAMRAALGPHADSCPVTGLKGMLGHAMAGAGAQSIISLIQAMQDDVIPPTINYLEPDPDCDLDYVPNSARSHSVNVGMANGIGMGGQTASLIMKRFAPGGNGHEEFE